MAIVNLGYGSENVIREGEYCPLHQEHKTEKGSYSVYLTHVGMCVYQYERNMYDDSDFFMVVWNEETQSANTIMFATTRGWSYPCYGSDVDASDEIKSKYKAWNQAEESKIRKAARAKKAALLIRERQEQKVAATVCNITYVQYRKLFKAFNFNNDIMKSIVALLKTKKFRSTFREGIAKQIRDWVVQDVPKHSAPLSQKQLQYI
jgi:hypothetical protein